MRSWPTITRFTWKRASSSTAAVAAKSGWSVESSGMESFLVGAVVGWLGRLGVGAKAMVHSLAEHQTDRTCEGAERSPQGWRSSGMRRSRGSQSSLRWDPGEGCKLAHMESEDAGAPRAVNAAAGWYPDPWYRGQRRYWDGQSWTAHSFPEDPSAGGAADPGSMHQLSAPWPAPTAGVLGTGPPPPEWRAPSRATEPEVVPPPPAVPAAPGRRPLWPPRGRALVAMLLALGFIVGLVGGALLLPHRGSAPPTTASQPAVTPAP